MGVSSAIVKTVTVDVSDDDTHSTAAYIGSAEVAVIFLPTLDNSKINFEASVDGSTWFPILDESLNKIEINAGTGEYAIELSYALVGGPWLRLVFGSSQTSDREISLVLKAH